MKISGKYRSIFSLTNERYVEILNITKELTVHNVVAFFFSSSNQLLYVSYQFYGKEHSAKQVFHMTREPLEWVKFVMQEYTVHSMSVSM